MYFESSLPVQRSDNVQIRWEIRHLQRTINLDSSRVFESTGISSDEGSSCMRSVLNNSKYMYYYYFIVKLF